MYTQILRLNIHVHTTSAHTITCIHTDTVPENTCSCKYSVIPVKYIHILYLLGTYENRCFKCIRIRVETDTPGELCIPYFLHFKL
jgi:hypothetical protein